MSSRIRLATVVAVAAGTTFSMAGALTAQDLVVGPSGAVATLTEALVLAPRGARIVVQPGVYREPTIEVTRPVTIEGEGAIFDGELATDVFLVTADSVTLRGLTIRNVATSFVDDRAAIRFFEVTGCVVEDNRFDDVFFGIYLARVSDCRIVGNRFMGAKETETKSGNAIHLWSSRDVFIADNVIRGHRDGIYFEFVTGAEVRRNVSTDHHRYGLHFMFSDRCEYRNNTFARNGAGVAVMYTKNVRMVDNDFEDNWGSAAFGLLLKDITDSAIERNRFDHNTVGLYAEGSNRVVVEANEFRGNGWAVKLMANSIDNTFRRNQFVGNSFDVATNSRTTASHFRENYWDNYRGYDLDRDGYGDVPFRPVRLFSLLVEQYEPSVILMRSAFVDLLDVAERVMPVLTPETLVDSTPLMRWTP